MTEAKHQPDPGFVSALEHQLTAEFRRRERLGPIAASKRNNSAWLRTAGFALTGLLLGAGSVTMAQRLEDAGRTELLLARAQAQVNIAAGRVDVGRRLAEDAMRRAEVGIVPMSLIYPTQVELIDAELQHSLAELDVAEIGAGGGPARQEIFAPRVGDRDFVSERLRLELDANAEHVELLEPIIELAETRVSAGIGGPDDLVGIMIERERLDTLATQIRDTLSLRQAYLDGITSAAETELRHGLLLATARRQIAEDRLDILQTETERMLQRLEVGLVPETDFFAAERDLRRAEAELEIAQLEIDFIRAELGE